MNLNEVEKHVKFDIIFQLLIYIGIGLCLILSIIVILATPAKAASNNINSNSHSTCGSSMGSGSYYGAFQNGTCYSRAIGTTYSGQASLVGFWLNYSFQAGKYYTITINFKDNDLLSSTIVDVVRVIDVANNRNEWTNTYNFISKKQFKVYFLAPNNTNSLAVSLASGSGDPITGVSNYGISSIYLEDNDNSDEIINSNNQNTQNIINNNNANSQDTQNVIIETNDRIMNVISNMCPNLANWPNNELNPIIMHADRGDYYVTTDNTIELTQGVTYYYHVNTGNQLENELFFLYNGGYADYFNITSGQGSMMSGTFTPPRTGSYTLRADCNIYNDNCSYWNFYISTVEHPYCPYGSATSKFDDISSQIAGVATGQVTIQDILRQQEQNQQEMIDNQEATYDYLTDDTNPSVDSNGIQSTMNMVQTNNPLSYLLTLPTNLLSAIINGLSSNSCQDFEIGKFGHVGRHDLGTYTFKFPCIDIQQKIGSNLYNTIDIFVSVGILVLTIVKLYNTISNYLTLGAEDEVKAHSHFLTPMDFLGNILGGNIGGIGSSLSSMSGGL